MTDLNIVRDALLHAIAGATGAVISDDVTITYGGRDSIPVKDDDGTVIGHAIPTADGGLVVYLDPAPACE